MDVKIVPSGQVSKLSMKINLKTVCIFYVMKQNFSKGLKLFCVKCNNIHHKQKTGGD